MNEVSVTPQATTISVSNYTTKTFEKYTKTVIYFHRWGSSSPQFLYLDLHGTVRNPSLMTIGHLIVYGVKETISNVDPSVYDTAFVIENGKMVRQTDLSLNRHRLRGSMHYIHGILDTSTKNKKRFSLNGCSEIITKKNIFITTIQVLFCSKPDSPQKRYPLISLKTYHGIAIEQDILDLENYYRSTQTTRSQTIDINLTIPSGCMAVDLDSAVKDEVLLMSIEYRTP